MHGTVFKTQPFQKTHGKGILKTDEENFPGIRLRVNSDAEIPRHGKKHGYPGIQPERTTVQNQFPRTGHTVLQKKALGAGAFPCAGVIFTGFHIVFVSAETWERRETLFLLRIKIGAVIMFSDKGVRHILRPPSGVLMEKLTEIHRKAQ